MWPTRGCGMAEPPIDLVLPWVDGQDPAWREQRQEYWGKKEEGDQQVLFRDWGLLRYWFRGVERALPWVRRVHFVTWGHLPPWLNTEHPRLHIVRHEEFLPERYRPAFSSSSIMLNIHRVPGLAEQFICTNDDFYFLAPVEPEEYFRDGLPCDCLHALPITEVDAKGFGHILWNNIDTLNTHFDLRECIQTHEDKWFPAAYPEQVLAANRWAKSLKRFPGFVDPHLPLPMLKSTFEEVWEKAHAPLHRTSLRKFRSIADCTEWLMRYWQFATGRFTPHVRKGGKSMKIGAPEEELRETLLSGRYRVVCLNEGDEKVNFARRKEYLRELFDIIFPEMSSFERF